MAMSFGGGEVGLNRSLATESTEKDKNFDHDGRDEHNERRKQKFFAFRRTRHVRRG
jgi:hypothetical protein